MSAVLSVSDILFTHFSYDQSFVGSCAEVVLLQALPLLESAVCGESCQISSMSNVRISVVFHMSTCIQCCFVVKCNNNSICVFYMHLMSLLLQFYHDIIRVITDPLVKYMNRLNFVMAVLTAASSLTRFLSRMFAAYSYLKTKGPIESSHLTRRCKLPLWLLANHLCLATCTYWQCVHRCRSSFGTSSRRYQGTPRNHL